MTSRSPATEEAGNILFLGKRFYTNKDALREKFGRIFHLPNEWSKLDKNVLLWLVDYHETKSTKSSLQGMEIVSTPVPSVGLARMIAAVFTRFRPKVVVASGDCYIGFLGWILARLTGAWFVFDIYDKYDEFKGYIRPLGFDLFGFLRRRADLCLYASRALAERLRPANRAAVVEVVPNGVDGGMFHPMGIAKCRETLGLDPSWTLVGYFGGMEPDRGVSDLVQAIDLIRKSGEDVRLLVCGKAHLSTPLQQPWIIYRGMVPHDEMPYYINASNALVVPYRLSDFMDMGASCKIAEYLVCGKPLVSTRTPNFTANFSAQALELGDALCRPEDPADMARAITHQLRHKIVASVQRNLMWPAISKDALNAIENMIMEGSSAK